MLRNRFIVISMLVLTFAGACLSGCSNDDKIKAEAEQKAKTDSATSGGGPSLAHPGGVEGKANK